MSIHFTDPNKRIAPHTHMLDPLREFHQGPYYDAN